MAWYKAGTVAVTQTNQTVTGTGTLFVSNVSIGDAFIAPDGKVYEVGNVVSDTVLTLATNYTGSTASGQSYGVQPTQSSVRDLALNAANLVTTFGAVRDGIGAGLIQPGTVVAPGLRFAADQDTGLRSPGANQIALVAGGADVVAGNATGVGIGTSSPAVALHVSRPTVTELRLDAVNASTTGFKVNVGDGYASLGTRSAAPLVFVTGDIEHARIDANGRFGFGTGSPQKVLHVANGDQDTCRIRIQNTGSGGLSMDIVGGINGVSQTGLSLYDATNGATRWAVDGSGNLLVGVTSSSGWGGAHRITKSGVAQGGYLLSVDGNVDFSAAFYAASGGGYSSAACAITVGKNTSTGRSINAGGTINASGADYAEYVRKADGCGPIAKGDVCGVDRDGRLTRSWAAAVRFVVKSTDPNLVGGDNWAEHLGERPIEPVYQAPLYDGPPPPEPVAGEPDEVAPLPDEPVTPTREDGEDDMAFIVRMAAHLVERAKWTELAAAQPGLEADRARATAARAADQGRFDRERAAYDAAQAAHAVVVATAETAHAAAMTVYDAALATFEQALEEARGTVDRIAFCGQTPINVSGDTLAACEAALADGEAVYLVAVANGSGIGVQATRESKMTLPLYMRRVGTVWRIEDSRPIIDVQHG